jgi:predicted dehydrogenase
MANIDKGAQVGLAAVGVGGFGRGLVDAIHRSEKLRLVACYDPDPGPRSEISEKYGCIAASTYDEILNNDSVEGVVIASPNFAHRENAVAAAEAGKHVFTDKPIANEIEDAYAMIDACRDAGVVLTVGHNFRRFGSQRKMKQLLDEGVPGKIVSVEANFSHGGGMGLTPQQWRWYPDKAPALPLIQLGLHCIDTMQNLLGPVAEVSSFMGHTAIPADNIDVTASVLRFENGLIGYIGSNYASAAVHYLNIFGTEANMFSGFGTQVRITRPGGKPEEIVEGPQVDELLEELEDFGNCIRTGAEPEVSGEAALMALAVVRAALKSSQEGRPVKLAEILAR